MRHEKIINLKGGGKAKIIVSFSAEVFRDCFYWNASVMACKPKGRKFEDVPLDFVAEAEIQEAKTELWNRIKP